MSGIIGYESAVILLEREARKEFRGWQRIQSGFVRPDIPGWKECQQARSQLKLSELHLIVSAATERKANTGTKYHVWTWPLPEGSLIKRDDGLVISSPEFCLLQMATRLTEVQLARLVMQFCGTFSPDPRSPDGTIERRPMTSVARLEQYLSQAKGRQGANRLRNAIRWAADNARSPREACLEILMVMPAARGGYHFPKPEMNVTLDDLSQEALSIIGQGECVVDLWWRVFLLAMEYLGQFRHNERFGSDLSRVNALLTDNILVLLVAKEQFEDARQMDMIAREASRKIGRQIRPERWPRLAKTQELIDELCKPLPTDPKKTTQNSVAI